MARRGARVAGEDRTVTVIDAGPGLGEAFVSGTVTADNYRVREGVVQARTPGGQRTAVRPDPGGGTRTVALAPAQQDGPVLADAQAVELAGLGRRFSQHFDGPHDIERFYDSH